MAGASLLALLDDITTILDDVSLMTKVAAKKTAGVLGDDLALNAQQVAGVQADRELPVVWAVAKGSFINKLILVPAALLISAVAPWLITPLLMIGGAYLCFEGFEKIFHNLTHNDAEEHAEDLPLLAAVHNPAIDMVAFEQDKIKGAIRTDFVLSAEIIVIALGVVEKMPFLSQVLTLSLIAIIMTVGVYGLVAGIVKLDDLGFHLIKDRATGFRRALGNGILLFAPWLMKALSIVGTAAMFLVGGGILLHGIPHSHDFLHGAELFVHQVGWVGGALAAIAPTLLSGLFGVLAGALVLAVVTPVSSLIGKFRQPS
jgi:predicted DNA repair protein MutK